ncbi:MAG TPA: hypothetical protein VEU29_01070 [Actinomycetota bacterium]|nr:hypothetical protein [Actinomycetota bacterium]
MRLAALPGRTSGGDGHSGIFPFDDHERDLHLLPLRLYEFPDGLYVVDAPEDPDLVGARLLAIEGTPVEDVVERVEPLVPRDNEMTLRARLPQFLVVAEVLNGLGVVDGAGPVDVELATSRGAVVETVEPVPADDLADAFEVWHPMIPPSLPSGGEAAYLRRADTEWWSAYLPHEDVVFVQYNQTVGDSFALGRRVVRLFERHDPRGVVLDLRHNPGGENDASAGLLDALGGRALQGVPLAVLVGRGTFSAAGYLSLHLRAGAAPVFVGEPTGFSTRFFGDPVSATLPDSGLVVNAGGVEWDEGPNGSFDQPLRPDVEVELTAKEYFAGEDPVLAAALDVLHRD